MAYQLGPILITDSVINTTGSLDVLDGNLGLQYKFVDLEIAGNYVIGDNSPATVYRFQNLNVLGAYTVEIPPAASCLNRVYYVSRGADVGGDTITLACSSNIEDKTGNFSTTFTLNVTSKAQWISDGTQWLMISYHE